jgi:hypothetical protein
VREAGMGGFHLCDAPHINGDAPPSSTTTATVYSSSAAPTSTVMKMAWRSYTFMMTTTISLVSSIPPMAILRQAACRRYEGIPVG